MSDFDPANESFHETLNRHGLKIFIKVVEPTDVSVVGNAYLAHGFSDVHDTGRMRAITAAFVRAGVRVIVWDATHSWGRSDGDIAEATFDLHHADLEDVVEWSRDQDWYLKRYYLAGFSLGGMVAGTFAAAHPKQVLGLVLACPVVSGPLLRRRIPWPMRLWWRVRGHINRRFMGMSLPEWEFVRSGWRYDLLAVAGRLVMPVLIVGARRDLLVPPRHLRRLLGAVGPDTAELVMVSGAQHGFDRPSEQERLRREVAAWLGVNLVQSGEVRALNP